MEEEDLTPHDEFVQREQRLCAELEAADDEAALVTAYSIEQLLERHPEMLDEHEGMRARHQQIRELICRLEDETRDFAIDMHAPSPTPLPTATQPPPRHDHAAVARAREERAQLDSGELSPRTFEEAPRKAHPLLKVVVGVVLLGLVLLGIPRLMQARQNASLRDAMNGVIRNSQVRGYEVRVRSEGTGADSVLLFDVRSLPSERDNNTCFQLFARLATQLAVRSFSFKKVDLCYKGVSRLEMSGAYFDELGALDSSNRDNARLTFASHVHKIDKPEEKLDPNATLQQQEEAFTELCEYWFGIAVGQDADTTDEAEQ